MPKDVFRVMDLYKTRVKLRIISYILITCNKTEDLFNIE